MQIQLGVMRDDPQLACIAVVWPKLEYDPLARTADLLSAV